MFRYPFCEKNLSANRCWVNKKYKSLNYNHRVSKFIIITGRQILPKPGCVEYFHDDTLYNNYRTLFGKDYLTNEKSDSCSFPDSCIGSDFRS